ncbi:MAG: DNA gyrase inhibitor YacG [Quisquiliibacterium sp.]
MTRTAPKVACPACARKTEFSPANRWRPFCSERCKTVDLGAWASNAYQIAGASLEEAADPINSEAQSPSASESLPHTTSHYRQ